MCVGGGGNAWPHPDNTLSLHSQSGPIINTRSLAGGSCSCNTAAISGLWNGGGIEQIGRKEDKGEGVIGKGGGGEGRLSLKLQLAAGVQTGFMVIALAAGHNPQHQGFS